MIRTMRAALCIAAILGAAAGAAQASGSKQNEDDGGFVIPGSTAGVNPAYHPEYFGSPPNRACFARFNTYDFGTGTYLGADGHRHLCKSQ
jgi:hypothetical protein